MALTTMQKRKLKKYKPYIITGGVVLVLGIFGGVYWYLNRDIDLGGELVKRVEMENVYDAKRENLDIANRDEFLDDEVPSRDDFLSGDVIEELKPKAVSVGESAVSEAFNLLGSYSNPILEKAVALPDDSPILQYFTLKEDAYLFVTMLNVTNADRRSGGDAGSGRAVVSFKYSKPGEPYGFLEPFKVFEQSQAQDNATELITKAGFVLQSGDAIRSFSFVYRMGIDGKISDFDLEEYGTEDYVDQINDAAKDALEAIENHEKEVSNQPSQDDNSEDHPSE